MGKRERKEDRKFQAELRQRALIQAEAERNARLGSFEEFEPSYGEEDGYDEVQFAEDDDQYYDNETALQQEAGDQGHLGVPTKPYDRVISDSTNEIADDGGKKKKK